LPARQHAAAILSFELLRSGYLHDRYCARRNSARSRNHAPVEQCRGAVRDGSWSSAAGIASFPQDDRLASRAEMFPAAWRERSPVTIGQQLDLGLAPPSLNNFANPGNWHAFGAAWYVSCSGRGEQKLVVLTTVQGKL